MLPPCSTSIRDEFAAADLGDQRLNRRLQRLAKSLAAQPGALLPAATGSWGQACAGYRFLDNERVSWDAILAPHFQRTQQRAQGEPLVLALTDSTTLNYSHHPATQGLGAIGSHADHAQGLWLHELLAMSLSGRPLGLLHAACWARPRSVPATTKHRNQQPITAKESVKWLRSYDALAQVAATTPHTRWVLVADREADIYELFERAQSPGAPAVLVRLQHDRGVEEPARRLFAQVQAAPVAGELAVAVPRRPGQRARPATLVVRFCRVRLRAPQLKAGRAALTLWAIEARELHPPQGVSPIHWRLLTTCAIEDWAGAVEKIQWYCHRWGIEVFHKVLKSICAVEASQLEQAVRLQRWLAIKLVVAWQTQALSQLGRSNPAAPVTEILTAAQWQVLCAHVRGRHPQAAGASAVGETSRWIAQLGGFLGRRGDGAPGPICLARGLQRLHDLAAGWQLAQGEKCA